MPALRLLRSSHALLAGSDGTDRLVRLAELSIVVLLACQAARLLWLLVPPAALGDPPSRTDILPPRPERLAIDAFRPGRAAGPGPDASGLRLFALRAGPDGGSAIIAGSDGTQRSYAVGEEVAPGVALVEVHADHAVLDNAGRHSQLHFSAPDARPAAPRTPASRPPPPAPATTPAAIDPVQLLAQAGLRPVESNGRISGYSVIPRGDGMVLRRAGLQAGDVLLSVNGQELTPERYAELGDSLAGASTITLTYRRDGQVRSATLQASPP